MTARHPLWLFQGQWEEAPNLSQGPAGESWDATCRVPGLQQSPGTRPSAGGRLQESSWGPGNEKEQGGQAQRERTENWAE